MTQKRGRRVHLRKLGVRLGEYPPARYNAITDVPGVRVGHTTIVADDDEIEGAGRIARTGVTAIIPTRDVFTDRVVGAGFILNGAGEVSGLTQVMEWGLIETPILLTNTLAVGTCSEAVVRYLVEQHPGIGREHDVIIPVVGECDDSWLNDISHRHIRHEHVRQAIDSATGKRVAEGNVGGGTGMVTCDFKGGIGTSSRKLPVHEGGFTVGVLVMTNFGVMRDLRVGGAPVGAWLEPEYRDTHKRMDNYGSIITVVATNAPLLPHQLRRLCNRAALGIGRVGSYAAHGSGEIVLGFSTTNTVPRISRQMIYRLKALHDTRMNPLYRACIEATEEAIINALSMATTMEGHSGHVAPEFPTERVAAMLEERGLIPQ